MSTAADTNGVRTRPRRCPLRDKKFIAEYLKDFDGQRAARAAGVGKGVASSWASKRLRDPAVIAALQAEMDAIKSPNVLSLTEALEILSAIARAKLGDYLDLKGNVDIDKLRTYSGSALAELVKDYKEGRVKVKLRDPIMAIERIAKLMGWDKPDEVKVTGEVLVLIPQQPPSV